MTDVAIMYVRPFLTAMGIAMAVCVAMMWWARWRPVADYRTGVRHCHKKGASRFGGVAMIAAFCVTLMIDPHLVPDRTVWVLIAGAVVIAVFGVIDDVHPLQWRTQLFVQIALVLLTFIFGVRIAAIAHPLGGMIPLIFGSVTVVSLGFMLVWMTVVMNAINWADGMDGLAGGTVVIAAGTIFVLALRPEVLQPPIAIIAVTFAGAVAGFLLFNAPPARIVAGTAGSFFMGYILAVVAIVAGAKVGTTLMVLAVPLVDAVWVAMARMRRHASVFHGDRGHLHHRLLRRGWRVWQVLLLYYTVTIVCATVALTTLSPHKWVALAVMSMCIIIFFLVYTRDASPRQHDYDT